MLNIWSSLAERYNRRLDEDDVVDILTGQVIKDRGVLNELPKRCNFGDLADKDGTIDTDPGSEAADNLAEADEDDNDRDEDDVEETHPFPSTSGLIASELARVAQLRPAASSSDVDDLHEFLKAEAIRRELDGGDDDSSSEDELNLVPPRLTPAKQTITPARKTVRAMSRPPKAPDPDTESEDELAIRGNDQADLYRRYRARSTPSPEVQTSVPSPPPLSSSPGPSSSFSLCPSPPLSRTPLNSDIPLQTEESSGSPTPQRQPVASTSRKTLEEIINEADSEFPPPPPRAPPDFARWRTAIAFINPSTSDDDTKDERSQRSGFSKHELPDLGFQNPRAKLKGNSENDNDILPSSSNLVIVGDIPGGQKKVKITHIVTCLV